MITIRASALSDFLDCAARAEAKHLLGLRTPNNSKALLGTAVHAATAVYDRSQLEGAGITIDEAAAAAVDAIHRPTEDVIWDAPIEEVEHISIALHKKYCTEIAPTQNYLAVEVTCDALTIEELNLTLTGTADRVRIAEEGYGVTDLKTGKSAVNADGVVKTTGHAYQIGVYELLAEFGAGIKITAPGEIVGMSTGKTARGQHIGKGEIHGAREALLGTSDSPGVLEIVSNMVHAGVFPGNPRSILCSPKYCPIFNRCQFRK